MRSQKIKSVVVFGSAIVFTLGALSLPGCGLQKKLEPAPSLSSTLPEEDRPVVLTPVEPSLHWKDRTLGSLLSEGHEFVVVAHTMTKDSIDYYAEVNPSLLKEILKKRGVKENLPSKNSIEYWRLFGSHVPTENRTQMVQVVHSQVQPIRPNELEFSQKFGVSVWELTPSEIEALTGEKLQFGLPAPHSHQS